MINELKVADYVLCLASPAYKERVENLGDPIVGRGARWEGAIITEELYEDSNTAQKKYIAVVLDKCLPEDIPDVLLPVGRSYYHWPQDDEDLYRRLTGQPRVLPAALGEIVLLPAEALNDELPGSR
jgi:hypothetical protein